MPRYLRMVRQARWSQPSWTDGTTPEWQGDALGDLSTGKNILSVYLADSDDKVAHAVAAFAANRDNLVNFDYAVIDSNLLARMNLRAVQKQGQTLHRLANRFHHDVIDLMAANVFALMQSISVTGRKTRSAQGVKTLLQRAIRPRACGQIILAHSARARIWQIARYDAAFLAYRVATPRHSLNLQNPFSTK